MNIKSLLAGILVLLASLAGYSQVGRHLPKSFEFSDNPSLLPDRIPSTVLAPPDRVRIAQEDAVRPGIRFAAPIKTTIAPEQQGRWADTPDGGRIWQVRLHSDQAKGLMALYDRFYLPPGAVLYMYNLDHTQVLGPYTDRDNPRSGKFLTGFIQGNDAIVEYYEPEAVKGQGEIHIFRVDYAYQHTAELADGLSPSGTLENELGFGTSDSCQVNVACVQDARSEAEQRAVCRVIMILEEGTGFCTGNMVNNTAQDGTPLLISAYHCQDGYTPIYDLWRFDFNYRSDSCATPETEPSRMSIVGCERKAGYQTTDFLLLELAQRPPASVGAYYLGWNKTPNLPANGRMYHHPRGDIKKISLDINPLSIFRDSISWNNGVKTPPLRHFLSRFDSGSFDVGSSGAAMLNEKGHFVGQLNGGNMACVGSTAFFGRLYYSWEGGGTADSRLKDWLDPLGINPDTLNGWEPVSTAGAEISGIIHTEAGMPIVGATVTLLSTEGEEWISTSDSTGMYRFVDIPFSDTLEIRVDKPDLAVNGCSTADLIKVQKHILGISLLETPYQWLAADVNVSLNISTQDLVQIRKVVLGVDAAYKIGKSWTFFPAALEFPDSPNPFTGGTWPVNGVFIYRFEDSIPDLDFIGIKYGDVNGSVHADN